jgi:hypothetical protein
MYLSERNIHKKSNEILLKINFQNKNVYALDMTLIIKIP